MNVLQSLGALSLALLLAACGEKQNTTLNAANVADSPVSEAAAQLYSGTGTVQSISDDKVTIAHGPIQGIGWPAMTMTFTAPSGVAEGVKVGSKVDFSFRQDSGGSVLTLLQPR